MLAGGFKLCNNWPESIYEAGYKISFIYKKYIGYGPAHGCNNIIV